MIYPAIILTAVLFFTLGRATARKRFSTKTASEMTAVRSKSKQALSERTEHRKDQILDLLTRELQHQAELANCSVADLKTGITRSDVERLLGVSEHTALKYLNQLESEDVIAQIGDSSKNTSYTLK